MQLSDDVKYHLVNSTIPIGGQGNMTTGNEIAHATWGAMTEGPAFRAHSPKADAIRAVKLTEKNIREVAAYILKALGGKVEVTALDDPIPGAIHLNGFYVTRVGYWLVELYDYQKRTPAFREATLTEREKYDLR